MYDVHIKQPRRQTPAPGLDEASGGIGQIVSGGIAPDDAGRPMPGGARLTTPEEAARHRVVTDAVQAEGGKIAMQILHFGRYASHRQRGASKHGSRGLR